MLVAKNGLRKGGEKIKMANSILKTVYFHLVSIYVWVCVCVYVKSGIKVSTFALTRS